MRKRFSAAMALALSCAMVLTACSGGSKPAETTAAATEAETTAAESAAEESSAEETKAAADIETVTPGKLTVATSPDFAPYEFYAIGEDGTPKLAGFDMDLTARENIYLNGTVLGFSPKYLDEKFDEIVEFSELQNFLDVPLKNYSSGMVARIGFAIATITKPDILIADEVLSVGDFLFQQKCEKRMQELMAGGTTVILVSHSIEQIERMCSKVAWLSHGRLKMNGDTETVCNAYKATQRGEA